MTCHDAYGNLADGNSTTEAQTSLPDAIAEDWEFYAAAARRISRWELDERYRRRAAAALRWLAAPESMGQPGFFPFVEYKADLAGGTLLIGSFRGVSGRTVYRAGCCLNEEVVRASHPRVLRGLTGRPMIRTWVSPFDYRETRTVSVVRASSEMRLRFWLHKQGLGDAPEMARYLRVINGQIETLDRNSYGRLQAGSRY
jgi:hypothetical protein